MNPMYSFQPWYRRIAWLDWLLLIVTVIYNGGIAAGIAYVVCHFVHKYW